jgi:hypothetical protein
MPSDTRIEPQGSRAKVGDEMEADRRERPAALQEQHADGPGASVQEAPHTIVKLRAAVDAAVSPGVACRPNRPLRRWKAPMPHGIADLMTNGPDNLALQQYLRRFDERQGRFEDAMQDLRVRMSSIEAQVTALRADMTHVLHRMDRMDERLLRIERRPDLADAPAG